LVLLVVVSLAVLLLLARLRFPDATLDTSAPAPGPLAGLAARAAFDDMATSLGNLLGRVSPSIVLVRLTQEAGGRSGTGGARSGQATGTPMGRLAAGLRIQPDLVVVYVPPGFRPEALQDGGGTADVAAADAARGLALIRVVPAGEVVGDPPVSTFSGFSYLGAVDVTPAGATIRPVFVGRADPVIAPAWSAPVLITGRETPVVDGTWLFSMDGRLTGMAIHLDDGVAIVSRESILVVAEDLARRSGAAQ
jgi:hypothetical protein